MTGYATVSPAEGNIVIQNSSILANRIQLTASFFLFYLSAGRKIFREFLRSEYSEENMLFWLACEELKKEENAEAVEEKARLIYEDYISILSPKEVSWHPCVLIILSP